MEVIQLRDYGRRMRAGAHAQQVHDQITKALNASSRVRRLFSARAFRNSSFVTERGPRGTVLFQRRMCFADELPERSVTSRPWSLASPQGRPSQDGAQPLMPPARTRTHDSVSPHREKSLMEHAEDVWLGSRSEIS